MNLPQHLIEQEWAHAAEFDPCENTKYSAAAGEFLDQPRFRVVPPAEWTNSVIDAIQSMRDLPENWDGEGADPQDVSTLEGAIRLLRFVAESDPTLPRPEVVPARDGGVQIYWRNGDKYFEVVVFSKSSANLYFRDLAPGALVPEAEDEFHAGTSVDTVVAYAQRVSS